MGHSGVNEIAAAGLIAEIGDDMSAFGSRESLASWAGLCPGNNESAGEIQEAKIILDRETGRSRGFAFVTFASDADANEALALDGQNLSGRDMRVSVATERPRRQGGGNREGGRRF